MPELPVKGLQSRDAGRLLVRLNWDYRNGIDRYGIAKIANNKNGKSILVLVLGHDDRRAIYMPYDIRSELGIAKGALLQKMACIPILIESSSEQQVILDE